MATRRKAPYVPPALGDYAKALQPKSGVLVRDLPRQTTTTLFGTMKTLDSLQVPFRSFQLLFGVDRRYPAAAFQRFLHLNREALAFLDIRASLEDDGNTLTLTSSRYVGCVAIKAPDTGKVVRNLMVTGRFNEDISELLSVIGDTILPEFSEELVIIPNEAVKPPLYFECANYLDKYMEAKRTAWQKFDSRLLTQSHPTSGTDWMLYAQRSHDPQEALRYPNRCNLLSRNHPEWHQLHYVLSLAIAEMESSRTSTRAKAAYAEKLERLKSELGQQQLQKTSQLQAHVSDPPVIKELKAIGNIILGDCTNSQRAWRLDFAVFFERYVQYLLHAVAQHRGAHDLPNPQFGITGTGIPKWSLRYLEPDLVLHKDGIQYVVDAKYKSHIYNLSHASEDLREVFRHDLHQLLAYCSFSESREKSGFLIYPAQILSERVLRLRSPINGLTNTVTLLGIPLKKSECAHTIDFLKERFVF